MNTKGIILQPELEKAVMDLGFSEFTEIQEKCIPLIQSGRDVIGQSYTGSGKTAAFGFPMLEKISHGHGLQALIIVPTRELCNQVAKEIFKFSKYKKMFIVEVYGGVSINPQIEYIQKADVVVGTPGRLLDHLRRGTINFDNVKELILDEADKMFDMGFIDDIRAIISKVPRQRQTMLFSATMSKEVFEIAKNYMINPERIKLQSYLDKEKIIQHYYNVDSKDKFSILVHLLKQVKGLTLIFCATRHMVDSIGRNLEKQGLKAKAIHGGLTQSKRKQVMDMFHDNKLDVLVASDVAARGLDIKGVTFVVNYDIPRTSKDYVHRIGRTARAGAEGKVVSLLAPQDHDNFRHVLEDRSLFVEKLELPTFERVEFSRGETRRGFGGPRGGRGGFGRNEGRGSGPRRFGGQNDRPDFSHRHNFGGDRPRSNERAHYGVRDSGREEKPRFGNRDTNRGFGGNRGKHSHRDMFRER